MFLHAQEKYYLANQNHRLREFRAKIPAFFRCLQCRRFAGCFEVVQRENELRRREFRC